MVDRIIRDETYRDRGCRAGGPSCLRCRLDTCVFDLVESYAVDEPPAMTLAEYAARSAFRKPEKEG